MSLFTLLVVAACSGGEASVTGPSEEGDLRRPEVGRVVVSPSAQTVAVGDTVRFTATVYGVNGSVLDRGVSWKIDDSSVAEVGGDGYVVGRSEGTTRVQARATSKTGEAQVTVERPGEVDAVRVEPQTLSLPVGETGQAVATLLDAEGDTVPGSASWLSRDTGVATVDGSGTVTARSEGSTFVVADASGVRDSLEVTVTPEDSTGTTPAAPASVTVSEQSHQDDMVVYNVEWDAVSSADAYDLEGGSNSGRWHKSTSGYVGTSVSFDVPQASSPDTSYACVAATNENGSSEENCHTFVVPGTDSGGTSPPPSDTTVDAVTVSPASTSVTVGGTTPLVATVTNASGDTLNRTVSWHSLDSPVASVDGSGTVTGVSTGTTGIVASADGVADTARVDVRSGSINPPQDTVVASVTLSPASAQIDAGNSVQFYATVKNSAGEILNRSASWRSLNAAVATVDASGYTTGQSTGTTGIVASVDGVADTAQVDVVSSSSPPSSPADFVEDFTSYRSTQQYLNDSRDIFYAGAQVDASHMAIDQNEGLDVDGFNLAQALRYTYPDRTNSGSRCGGYRIDRTIRWSQPGVENIPSSVNHVWMEVYAKWESDYETRAPRSWNCDSAPAQKFLFALIDNNCTSCPAGRFDINVGVFGDQIHTHLPHHSKSATWGNDGTDLTRRDVFDGQWHQFRYEVKLPTIPDSQPGTYDGSGDGIVRVWIDGQLIFEALDVHTAARDLTGMKLGSNINQGPDHSQSYWWGRIAVWRQNPGW